MPFTISHREGKMQIVKVKLQSEKERYGSHFALSILHFALKSVRIRAHSSAGRATGS
jgi:hypothetical protein